MFWKYIEKKVEKSIYPDNRYWPPYMPHCFQKSIYRKYGFNAKFQIIRGFYYFFVNKYNRHCYNNDIKFFYFTLFKKNGFIFILFCCILYQNCFLEFLYLILKALIAFYLIIWFIYIILLLRKYIYISIKIYKRLCITFIMILVLINFNSKLNQFFNNSEWYF